MHFAKVKNNIVERVIVAEQEFIDTLPDEAGVSWIQTSYNTSQGIHYDPETGKEDDKPPLRGNFAGEGFIYDPALDVFAPPKPYPSWTFNADTLEWSAPVTPPSEDGKLYLWNEDTKSWKEVT